MLGSLACATLVLLLVWVFLAVQLALFFISVLAAMDDMPQLVALAPVEASAPPRAALAAAWMG